MNDLDGWEDVIAARVADPDGKESSWQICWRTVSEEYLISLSDPVTGRTWSARGPDLFDALCELRRQVEPLGIRICVSGARIDVRPSGMSRDMGGGQMAYILRKPLRLGRLLRFLLRMRPPLIDILSPARCDLVVSVAEQELYFQEWANLVFRSPRRH
jgi:hypothetical protein